MEIQNIIKTEVGFAWHISIDREMQRSPGYFSGVESAARSSDKETIHASLEGHSETYDNAHADLVQARDNLKAILDDFNKGKKEVKPE